MPPYPVHAGYPVRCGFSVLSLLPLNYWVTRGSLSSGAHSRDPLAGDDNRVCVRVLATQIASELCLNLVPSPTEGAGNAGCLLHPRSRVQSCAQRSAHEHTGTVGALRHSLRNGLTAYAVLSPATNSSCHRRWRISG